MLYIRDIQWFKKLNDFEHIMIFGAKDGKWKRNLAKNR